MNSLQKLALGRLGELGQEVFNTHEDLMRWRETPLESVQQTELSIKLKRCVMKQKEWIDALLDDEE